MLGHWRSQGSQDLVFQIATSPLSKLSDVTGYTLVGLSIRYPQVADIYQVFGVDTFRFLSVFSGMAFRVPRKDEDIEYTLLPEISLIFGLSKLVRFIEVFSGCVLKVPPESVILSVIQNVDIYLSMEMSQKKFAKRLSRHYRIQTKEVWWTYRRMEEQFNGGGEKKSCGDQKKKTKARRGVSRSLDDILGPEEPEEEFSEEAVRQLVEDAEREVARSGYGTVN